MINLVGPIIFVSLMILAVIGLLMYWSFLRRLKEGYPDVWQELGEPSLIMNNSIKNGLRTQSFLMRREYEKLNDPEFVRFCGHLRTFNISYIVYFIICFAVFLILL